MNPTKKIFDSLKTFFFRPRDLKNMKITITTISGEIATLDLDETTPIDNLKDLIQIEFNIPPKNQKIVFNGNNVVSGTLSSNSIGDGDLLFVSDSPPKEKIQTSQFKQAMAEALRAIRPQSSSSSQNPQYMPNMPLSHNANLDNSNNNNNNEDISMIPMDSYSLEAQKAIEERIRQENILKNMELALEYNPESFGSVVMLFVPVKVNNQNVVAFVDSGAQATILSLQCAERCGLDRLIDTRFQGIAKGVGTAKIIGRIHLAVLEVAGEFLECSFTVMQDQSLDMLLGLDMLRKHRAIIDLKDGCLRIHSSKVDFLPEKDIPFSFRNQSLPSEPLPASSHPGSSSSLSLGLASANAKTAAAAAAIARNSQQMGNMVQSGLGGASASQLHSNTAPRSSTSSVVTESKIQKLMELGFSRNDVIQALQVCEGNEEAAASFLTQNAFGCAN